MNLQRFDLINRVSEDEDILLTDFFTDLDIRTIEGADRQRTIQRKLHVTSAGCFLTRSRNLLRQIGGWNHLLGHGDTIVLREDDLDLIVDPRVVVHLLGNFVNRTDNVLRQCVARRSLRTEDEYTWIHFVSWIVQQATVQRQDMQHVQVLTLVFVQTFDLHIEQCVWANHCARVLQHEISKYLFVCTLDVHEALLELRIIGKLRNAL